MLIQQLPTYPTTSTTGGAGCSICHVPQRHDHNGPESVYDLGVQIDWEGGFVICHECALEIGGNAGMISPAKARDLKSQANKGQYQARKARAVQEPLLAARDALNDAITALRLGDAVTPEAEAETE